MANGITIVPGRQPKESKMLRYKLLPVFFYLLMAVMLFSCGRGTISIDSDQYQPKIVVEGYLRPGQAVNNIIIRRNFPLGANLNNLQLHLSDAVVTITDLASGSSHPLVFNSETESFRNENPTLEIGFGKSYRLNVVATIDGSDLQASAITTVPRAGFSIMGLNHDSLLYRQRDNQDNLIDFVATFNRSPGVDFYAANVLALDAADTSTFIFDNPLGTDTLDVLENINDYRFSEIELQDTPLTTGISNLSLFWWAFSFYGEHQVIVFAADSNYRNFYNTYDNIEEIGGNFHEPLLPIEGDGVGVFGSIIADTVYLKVLNN